MTKKNGTSPKQVSHLKVAADLRKVASNLHVAFESHRERVSSPISANLPSREDADAAYWVLEVIAGALSGFEG